MPALKQIRCPQPNGHPGYYRQPSEAYSEFAPEPSGERWTTTTKVRPLSAGTWSKNVFIAARPPAEAPIPTTVAFELPVAASPLRFFGVIDIPHVPPPSCSGPIAGSADDSSLTLPQFWLKAMKPGVLSRVLPRWLGRRRA